MRLRPGPLARLLAPLLALHLLAATPAQGADERQTVIRSASGMTAQPSATASDPVTATLPSNWARYGVIQHDVYLVTLQAGDLTFSVPPATGGHRTEVLFYDPNQRKLLMDRVFDGRSGESFTLNVSESRPYQVYLLFNRLQSLTLTGPGLSVQPGTPAVVLPVAPYTTWNGPQSVQAELRNPSETEDLALYLGNTPISLSLLQPDGSVAAATVDTSGLADGIYDLLLVGLAHDQQSEGLVIRPILVDRVPAFADVPFDHWAHHPIEVLFHEKIVNGKETGQFAPEDSVTRAEFAKMLAGTLGIEPDPAKPFPFVDVTDAWARPYVQALYEAGLVLGEVENGQRYFRPDRTITRAEAATIIARELGLDGPTDAIPSFTDWASVPDWARSAVANLVEQGWLHGYPDNTFRPDGELARAEAAKVLSRFLGVQ